MVPPYFDTSTSSALSAQHERYGYQRLAELVSALGTTLLVVSSVWSENPPEGSFANRVDYKLPWRSDRYIMSFLLRGSS